MTYINTTQAADAKSSGLSLFQIKNRFSGEILFEIKTKSLKLCVEAAVKAGALLDGALLNGASLNGASLDGASLDGASFNGAFLDGASLDGASLDGASLDGAYLNFKNKKIEIQKTPICISNLKFEIVIFDSHMKIGCQFHSISEWFSFDTKTISDMDTCALELWEQNKDWIKAICKANGRGDV